MIPHMWSTHQTLPAVTVGETILESSGKKRRICFFTLYSFVLFECFTLSMYYLFDLKKR